MLDAAPSMPELTADVWALYLDLHKKRQAGLNGPLRLPSTEIEAYLRLYCVRASLWQLHLLDRLEDTYFEVRVDHEASKPKNKGDKSKELSGNG